MKYRGKRTLDRVFLSPAWTVASVRHLPFAGIFIAGIFFSWKAVKL